MALFDLLKRLFLLIFPSWGNDHSPERERARLIGKLRQDTTFYEPLTNTLKAPFAQALSELQGLTVALVPVYRVILGPDEARRRSLLELLVTQRLERVGVSRDDLAFPNPPPPTSVEDWERTFSAKRSALRRPEVVEAARGWTTNLRLADLCAFDFEGLLEPFYPSGVQAAQPRRSTPAPRVLTALTDLYFLLPGLVIDRATAAVVVELGAALGLKTDPAELERLVTSVGAQLGRGLSPEFLADVIHCAGPDPFLGLHTTSPVSDPLPALEVSLTEAWNRAKEAYLKAKADLEFQSRVGRLFGSPPLEVDGYDSVTQGLVTRLELGRLAHVAPLRLVKNALVRWYQPTLRPALGELFVQGQFLDNEFKKGLVTVVDRLDALVASAPGFEAEAGQLRRTRIEPLRDLEESKLMALAARESLAPLLEVLETKASSRLQEFGQGMATLEACLGAVVDDWDARAGQVLGNVATLEAKAPALRAALSQSLGTLSEVRDLLTSPGN